MKKAIVTTTINSPTEALVKFAEIAERDGWALVIVGDQKTPHAEYGDFCARYECASYLTPAIQEDISPELSDLTGWNCIQRRNFGLVAAWRNGAEVIAMVDDDNIPYDHWGKNVLVGQETRVGILRTSQPVFDPLAAFFPGIWHRGFPIQLLSGREAIGTGLVTRKPLVQADLWDGDPDVDAICRITLRPEVTFNPQIAPFAGTKMGPFNSQNTFISREILPTYFLFPHIGRMDDIWAAYVTQLRYPDSVIYAKASVRQVRNEHNLFKDLQAEMLGYEHSIDLVEWLDSWPAGTTIPDDKWPGYIPTRSLEAYKIYRSLFV